MRRFRAAPGAVLDTFAVGGGAADFAGPVACYLGLLTAALDRPTRPCCGSEPLTSVPLSWVLGSTSGWRAAGSLRSCHRHERVASKPGRSSTPQTASPRPPAAPISPPRWPRPAPDSIYGGRGPRCGVTRTDGRGRSTAGECVCPDVKGLPDLAILVQSPWTSLAATDLFAGTSQARRLGADQVLDGRARAASRRRLSHLADEENEADHLGDVELSRRVQVERRQIVDALRSATGLGGRPRLLGDTTERARRQASLPVSATYPSGG